MEIENGSCDSDHAPFRGGLSSVGKDLIHSTCLQNLTILALSCSRDIGGDPKFKVGHVTQTTPLLRVICHQYAGT